MSNFTLKIDTGELTEALYALAQAIGGAQRQTESMAQSAPAPVAQSAPAVQPVPVTQPAAVPTAPTQPAVQQLTIPRAPVAQPEYSLDALQRAATPLADAGLQPELIELLAKCGVQAITQLPKDAYPSFAEGLRKLGAKI